MFETRADYIANSMGHKLTGDRLLIDTTLRTPEIKVAMRRAKTLAKDKGETSEEFKKHTISTALLVLQKLAEADPTKNQQYLQWIAKRWFDNDFRGEDLERVKGELQDFEKFKPKLKADEKSTDINHYKSAGDVFALIDHYRESNEAHSKKEEARRHEEKYFNERHAELFFKGDTIKVIVPKTQDAACHFGKGTRWCTAAEKSFNAFKTYHKQGPLYIIMTPDGKYQFHFPTHQFMNNLDQSVNVGNLVKKYPEIKDAFDKEAQKQGFILLMKKVTPNGLYNALDKSINAEKKGYIPYGTSSETPGVILAAVDKDVQDERIARLIANYSVNLALKEIRPDLQAAPFFQRAIIQKRPELLQSTDPAIQDAEMIKSVIAKAPTMLRYVRSDLMTKALIMNAVKQMPQVLGQVPEEKQDLDVISTAFRATPNTNTKRTLINMVHNKDLQKQLVDAMRKTL